jgi:hypothetical protein
MKYVYYSGAQILTSDVAALALLRYATALSRATTADAVDLPAIDEFGCAVTEYLLVGPASQIALVGAPDDVLEPEDAAFALDLGRRTEALVGS